MIYTMTDKYVYFVRIPTSQILSVGSVDRLTEFYHTAADRLARMDSRTFRNAVSSTIPPSKGRVVMLHSPPYCGGSLLGGLLRSIDQTQRHLLVHGEPPVLNALSVLVQLLPIETMRSITFAALRFTVRHIDRDQVVVMKVRSCCTKIVPYVHASTPSIQHLYVTSKDPNVGIAKLVSTNFSTFNMPEVVRKVGPSNPYEFALAQVMGCIISYQRNLKYFALEAIYAEDLIDDPMPVMHPVLDVCGVFLRIPASVIDWLNDQREESRVQTSSMNSVLSDVQRSRMRLLLDYLQQDWCI
ncbi:unnamed protein product [Angiostrongylus costaricensis]|uniref:Proteasome assembly chaperone 1 n=1 Tax=Angiostrongylus costaricensis TaxID=334426 RepID=A0A0R3PDY3_ANGCS|nr:unnamed protein product [Angiostrongylus costaricensis]